MRDRILMMGTLHCSSPLNDGKSRSFLGSASTKEKTWVPSDLPGCTVACLFDSSGHRLACTQQIREKKRDPEVTQAEVLWISVQWGALLPWQAVAAAPGIPSILLWPCSDRAAGWKEGTSVLSSDISWPEIILTDESSWLSNMCVLYSCVFVLFCS